MEDKKNISGVLGIVKNATLWLFLAAVLAIILSNSTWSGWYEKILQSPIILQIGQFNFFTHHGTPMSLLTFVNDFLMAIFFLTIGLEIKQQILTGELHSFRKALLPIVGALGGMIVPVLVFYLFCHDYPRSYGAAIPMATDIAFAVGVLALLSKKVPPILKIFLITLAVVDDIGGILVMILFYSSHVSWMPLIFSVFLLIGMFFAGAKGVHYKRFYYIFGFVVWLLFLESGVHAAISGVLIALVVPAKPKWEWENYLQKAKRCLADFVNSVQGEPKIGVLSENQTQALAQMRLAEERVVSPLQSMEHQLQGFVSYVTLPLFAFVNAGIRFENINADSVMGVPLAIMAGLVLGKSLGIFSFVWFFIKCKLISLPKGMNYSNLFGVAILGGIGFTVSLFIANLSYGSLQDGGIELLNQAKIGVFAGSLLSGLLGYFWLKRVCK
ncbi:MAG: Na+/H+ antiporter NhaA [Bacteroidales bacterium]